MQLGRIQHHPDENGGGLPDDVLRCAEEPRGLLREPSERIVAERTMHLRALLMLQLIHGLAGRSGAH
jgi:hypothetical protein